MAATYRAIYTKEVNSWDWSAIVADAKNNPVNGADTFPGGDVNQTLGYAFLGTVFALAPSGKFYTFWTTNQTANDVKRDTAFYEALDKAANEHGGWIENGEGDACDLFFVMDITEEKGNSE